MSTSSEKKLAPSEVLFKAMYSVQWAQLPQMMNEKKSGRRRGKCCTKSMCSILFFFHLKYQGRIVQFFSSNWKWQKAWINLSDSRVFCIFLLDEIYINLLLLFFATLRDCSYCALSQKSKHSNNICLHEAILAASLSLLSDVCIEKVNYHNTTFLDVVKGTKDLKHAHVLSQQLFANAIHIKLCKRPPRKWPLDALYDDCMLWSNATQKGKMQLVCGCNCLTVIQM